MWIIRGKGKFIHKVWIEQGKSVDGIGDYMEDKRSKIEKIIENSTRGVKEYLKAQLILMLIAFVILALGFYIIGGPAPIVVSLLISLIDIIPVVGSGLIMIPWAIIAAFRGQGDFAVKLVVLYLSLTIIRQLIEPKITGDRIGLRPLYTFLASFLGSLFLGPLGVFLGPIIAIVANAIYQERYGGLEEILDETDEK